MGLKKEIQYKGCPFCNIDEGEFVENYQTKQALFYKFKKCNRCSLVYPYPRPNKDIIENYFTSGLFSKESEVKFKHLDEKQNKNSFLKRIIKVLWRKSTLHYSYNEFIKYAKKGDRVLAVGSGHGVVAQRLCQKGCIVETVELNPYRAKYLREKGFKVYESLFAQTDLPESSYDIIVFSQVLMHLFSLKETIQKVRYTLRPGGLLISSQMNFNSTIQKTLRSPFPGRGLTAFSICSWFTPESLTKILKLSGFEVKHILFRPTGLLNCLFVEGSPGGGISRSVLRVLDQIVTLILVRTGTSDYFAIVAKKI